ncbi:MAG: transglutaminase family protein, partial [Rhodobacteraceae bacterium]|nr:transglutaminase family protein [Paracoccaceae bacterium]
MHLTIEHSTTYEFEDTPDYGLQQVRLKPKDSPSQRVENWELSVTGGEFQAEFNDHYRNAVTLLSIDAHAESITVRCQG